MVWQRAAGRNTEEMVGKCYKIGEHSIDALGTGLELERPRR